METGGALRIVKELFVPEMTIFNISFLYIGVFFANYVTLGKFVLITIAFISARASGLLMNRYIGREYDLKNEKKIKRMASLVVSRNNILVMFFVFAIIFIITTYFLNFLSFALSFLVLALFVIDPILKRYTRERHFSIGLIESFSLMGGYIGARGAIPNAFGIYVLMLGIIFIGSGFDMIVSIIHTKFDRTHRLQTYSSNYGITNTLKWSLAYHLMASFLIIIFALTTKSYIILIGSFVAVIVLVYEHIDINYKTIHSKNLFSRAVTYNSIIGTILLFTIILSRFIV